MHEYAGLTDGLDVGTAVGADVGLDVGVAVGDDVGAIVGTDVGLAVGCALMGADDGLNDGMAVGNNVCATVVKYLTLILFTLTYTHILTVLWLYKVNIFCNTSSSSTPLYLHNYNTYI